MSQFYKGIKWLLVWALYVLTVIWLAKSFAANSQTITLSSNFTKLGQNQNEVKTVYFFDYKWCHHHWNTCKQDCFIQNYIYTCQVLNICLSDEHLI